ncbi:MAG: serine/threonine-protein kinase [Blastocatellia bacterium]|nr:serine/threonine-protein kinase [Blastocatellia bacterium]
MRYCPSCHRCFNDGVGFCLFDQAATFLVESLPPVIDGKYRLERLIAHGGMGSVYRAMHLQLEREVAIKILRAEFLADAMIRERFNREARAAARLKHPNIVSIYDFGVLANGGAYLVMELIEGRSLREEMRLQAARAGQMRPERAARILAQVCAGIEAAHRQAIIHRDLKPDNIMIETGAAPPYGSERVLVLDFGIAKLKDREQPLLCITDENTIVGTPNYISPEQCAGQAVDARSDVYSLGIILYEMLTGQTPFAGHGTSAVLLRHIQEPPLPPSRRRPELSAELEQVVLRALAKNPERRFASAAMFAEQLVAAVTRTSPLAPAPPAASEAPEPPEEEQTLRRPRPGEAVQPAISPDLPAREPSLLIEHRPRYRFYAAFAALLLLLGALLGRMLYGEWRAQADDFAEADAGLVREAPLAPPAAAAASPVGKSVQPREARGAMTPELGKRGGLSAESNGGGALERARREIEAVYADWVATASRGDWKRHMDYYGERVDYFRDGALSRERVESRKRRIFGGVTRYSLRFSDKPQILMRTAAGDAAADEAEILFDRQWRLCRGRKCRDGRARGAITLKLQRRGWRIVSERQIGRAT